MAKYNKQIQHYCVDPEYVTSGGTSGGSEGVPVPEGYCIITSENHKWSVKDGCLYIDGSFVFSHYEGVHTSNFGTNGTAPLTAEFNYDMQSVGFIILSNDSLGMVNSVTFALSYVGEPDDVDIHWWGIIEEIYMPK